jgi:hypothetical protein
MCLPTIPVVAATHLPSLVVAALVLIATGVRTTFGLHENWVEQSRIRYAIEREVALYLVKASPYASSDATYELVKTVEAIAWEAGQQWATRRLRAPASSPASAENQVDA